MEVSVCEATALDITAIAHIHTESWRDAYRGILDEDFLAGLIDVDRLQLWNQRLETPPDGQFVIKAVAGSAAIAFISLYLKNGNPLGMHIDNLHVLPAYRGNKVGRQLLHAGAGLAQKYSPTMGMHLWVFEATTGATRFYQRLGGKVIDRSTSLIPSAQGKPILLLHWKDLSAFGQ